MTLQALDLAWCFFHIVSFWILHYFLLEEILNLELSGEDYKSTSRSTYHMEELIEKQTEKWYFPFFLFPDQGENSWL